MNTKLCMGGLLVLLVFSANAMAVALCTPGTPNDRREKSDLDDAKISAVQREGHIFSNNERQLPGTNRNEVYYEYTLGQAWGDGAGKHRAVLLVLLGQDKRRVIKQYYTSDHYRTFCEIRQ